MSNITPTESESSDKESKQELEPHILSFKSEFERQFAWRPSAGLSEGEAEEEKKLAITISAWIYLYSSAGGELPLEGAFYNRPPEIIDLDDYSQILAMLGNSENARNLFLSRETALLGKGLFGMHRYLNKASASLVTTTDTLPPLATLAEIYEFPTMGLEEIAQRKDLALVYLNTIFHDLPEDVTMIEKTKLLDIFYIPLGQERTLNLAYLIYKADNKIHFGSTENIRDYEEMEILLKSLESPQNKFYYEKLISEIPERMHEAHLRTVATFKFDYFDDEQFIRSLLGRDRGNEDDTESGYLY